MSVGALARRALREHVRIMGSVIAVETDEPVVVMTFDDGPEPPQTERVLEALRTRRAHATFFMLSARARRHPSLVREVVQEGHEIALHGIDHRELREFTSAEVTRRTEQGRRELEDVAGAPVRWMRPPYGRLSPRTYRAVRRTGLVPVLWGGSCLDGAERAHEVRLASALRVARPGLILLAHDGRADASDGVDDPAIAPFDRGALAADVLDAYAAIGLRGTSLERALEHGHARTGAWFG